MGLEGPHEVKDAAAGHVGDIRVVVEIALVLLTMPVNVSRHATNLKQKTERVNG